MTSAKKFLAMFISVLMILSSVGTIAFAADAVVLDAVNVVVGQSYTLPTTIGEYENIVWNGTVSTQYVGVQTITGTCGETPLSITVNVGEYTQKYSDLLAGFNTNIVIDNDTTGTNEQYTAGNGWLVVATGDAPDIEIVQYDEATKALKVGPNLTGTASWLGPKSKYSGEYRLNMKLKLEACGDYEKDTYVSRLDILDANGGTPLCRVAIYVTADGYVKLSAVNSSIAEHNGNALTAVKVDENGKTPWFDISYEIHSNKTWSVLVNQTPMLTDKAFFSANETVAFYGVSVQDQIDADTSHIYCTDVTLDEVRYVTGALPASVSAKVEKDAPSAQTTTVSLAMSDGTTKTFTVNFDADTATAGTGKTADGTINGFDGTIPVTYTVVGVTDKTINTYVGADVTLADGTKADTTAFGRKYYKVTTEAGIINYTVNVGEFTSKVKDTMSGHTADTTDALYETIVPKTVDGMSLNLKKGTSSSEANSIKLREIDGNKVLMLDKKTASDHATWRIADGFSGTYKVKMRLKADKNGIKSGQYGLRFSIHNTSGTEIFRCLLNLTDNSGQSYSLGVYRNDQQSTTYAKAALKTSDNTNYTTGWLDVEVIGKDTGTFDVFVNNVRVATDHQLMTVFDTSTSTDTLVPVSTNRNIGSVVVAQRYDYDVVSYIDDLEIFNYRCYDGNPSDSVEVLLGQGEANTTTLYLPTSNGSVKAFENITLPSVNTAIIGDNSLELSIPGFDDKFNVNAKVCNYHVSAIGYKVGNEFATAPQNGGSISTVQIENKGSLSAATALFAWYNSSHKLESVKKVNISGIGKNESKTVEVGLALPANVAGGYLKVFVLDSVNKLIPVDVAEVFENNGGAAPTIYTVGDSTMCNYPEKKNGQWPRTGIGMVLGNYFTGATVNNNYASSGEWTESFIEEGWWTGIKNNLKEGDYVIISLGHNDQGACSEKYSATECVYKENLKKMIDDAQAACANVILYSPIRRQHEADADTYPDPFGKVDEKQYEKHSHYADMVELAQDEGVPYIDMTAISAEMLAGKPTEEQQKYYVRDLYNSVVTRKETYYTSHENWAENSYFKATINEPLKADNDAMADTSHYNVFGAKTYARRIADEIKALDIILSDYVNDVAVGEYPALD